MDDTVVKLQESEEHLKFYQEKWSVLADSSQYVNVRSRLWKGYASLASCSELMLWADKIKFIQDCGLRATDLDVGTHTRPFWISLPISKWLQDVHLESETNFQDWCAQSHNVSDLPIWETPSIPHWLRIVRRLIDNCFMGIAETVSTTWKSSAEAITITSKMIIKAKKQTTFNKEGWLFWLLEPIPIDQIYVQQAMAAELLNLQLRSYLGCGGLDLVCLENGELTLALNIPRADTTPEPSEREQRLTDKVKAHILDECFLLILRAWRELMPSLMAILESEAMQQEFSERIDNLFSGDKDAISTFSLQAYRDDVFHVYNLLEDSAKRWGLG